MHTFVMVVHKLNIPFSWLVVISCQLCEILLEGTGEVGQTHVLGSTFHLFICKKWHAKSMFFKCHETSYVSDTVFILFFFSKLNHHQLMGCDVTSLLSFASLGPASSVKVSCHTSK